ncbi:hypothetical protein IL306_011876 [Fusarium sp. DS 682]|nr:hypothetical protein IL306_011876 [Fusarium sp. DS 682]
MHSLTVLVAAFTALATAHPAQSVPDNLQTRADPVLGPATCPSGDKFKLNENDAVEGAEAFKKWIESGADGKVHLSGNFKGNLGQTYGGITFFACDYKSGGAGSFINGNLVEAVLGKGQYLDVKCDNARGGYERSNDLTIGRTFSGDHYC